MAGGQLFFDANADASLFIGIDQEGRHPSYSCGMEGHKNLAEWIFKQECDYFTWVIHTKYGIVRSGLD